MCSLESLLRTNNYTLPGPSRGGKGGEFSRTQRRLGGPASAQKYWKRVFEMASFWLQECIKSIFGGAWELTTLPQTPSRMVRGHASLRFLLLDVFGVSVSAHEVVIGPRNNGFTGPAVALDGPAYNDIQSTNTQTDTTENNIIFAARVLNIS